MTKQGRKSWIRMEYFNLVWRRGSGNCWSNLRWLNEYLFQEKKQGRSSLDERSKEIVKFIKTKDSMGMANIYNATFFFAYLSDCCLQLLDQSAGCQPHTFLPFQLNSSLHSFIANYASFLPLNSILFYVAIASACVFPEHLSF